MLTKSVANPVHSGQNDHFLAHEKKIHILKICEKIGAKF